MNTGQIIVIFVLLAPSDVQAQTTSQSAGRDTVPVTAENLSKDQIGTRYVAAAVRTLLDPADPKDVQQGGASDPQNPAAADRDPELRQSVSMDWKDGSSFR